jgi:hypothetical protein
MYLGLYLSSIGKRLDCYFTVEQVQSPTKPDILTETVEPDLNNKNIGDLVGFLGRNLEGYEVFQSPSDRAVVHIVAAKTRAIEVYWLDCRIYVSFEGSPSGLLAKILNLVKFTEHETVFSIHSMPAWDLTARVRVFADRLTIRRVLTEYLPLSRYSRVLWNATTRPKGETQVVSVSWGGPPQFEDKVLNKLVPFSEGEEAFYRNTKSAEAIAAAVDYIKAQMQTENPIQVRWAMFFLGKSGVAEAVPLLTKHLTYKYTTCGVLEESYPAVLALSMMDKIGSAAALKAIGTETDSLRLKLLCRVVLLIEGQDNGAKAVEAEVAKLAGDRQQLIRDALKAVAEPQAVPQAPAAK